MLRDDFITGRKWIVMNCTINEYINQAWNGGVFREEPTKEVIEEFARYNGLDDTVAKQYFNKYCANGCKLQSGKRKRIKEKNVLSMNLKFHGRNINKFYCKKCLMAMHDLNEEKWNLQIERFRDQGCKLF